MAQNYFKFKVDDLERVVTITETTSREIEISGRIYTVPAGVVDCMREMAGEIEAQQNRRAASDQQINNAINGRIDSMLKALAARGMLAKPLDANYPLPAGIETDGGTWTFLDEARQTARDGLQNEYKDDLAADIGTRGGKVHKTA